MITTMLEPNKAVINNKQSVIDSMQEQYQKLSADLFQLLPKQGKCEQSRSTNKHLERFRIMNNLMYDLNNNGLYNRRKQFRSFFGVMPICCYCNNQDFRKADEIMSDILNDIILKAVVEQYENLQQLNKK